MPEMPAPTIRTSKYSIPTRVANARAERSFIGDCPCSSEYDRIGHCPEFRYGAGHARSGSGRSEAFPPFHESHTPYFPRRASARPVQTAEPFVAHDIPDAEQRQTRLQTRGGRWCSSLPARQTNDRCPDSPPPTWMTCMGRLPLSGTWLGGSRLARFAQVHADERHTAHARCSRRKCNRLGFSTNRP